MARGTHASGNKLDDIYVKWLLPYDTLSRNVLFFNIFSAKHKSVPGLGLGLKLISDLRFKEGTTSNMFSFSSSLMIWSFFEPLSL